jgi:hypothetical protein
VGVRKCIPGGARSQDQMEPHRLKPVLLVGVL